MSCAGILFGESAVPKMKQVSLSNDTVKSRIFDMSCNIKSQLSAHVKASPVFATQLNESVDVASLSQLIVFVRYVHDQSIEENLLFCRPLETTTQAACMQLVDAVFEEEGLDWGKLVHACTDGAPGMFGARSGFAKLLKQKNLKVVTLHCIIHREALASRTMTQPLKEALETAIGLVNIVKASALNTHFDGCARIWNPHCRSLVVERRHVTSACAFASRSYRIFGRMEQTRSESCFFRRGTPVQAGIAPGHIQSPE